MRQQAAGTPRGLHPDDARRLGAAKKAEKTEKLVIKADLAAERPRRKTLVPLRTFMPRTARPVTVPRKERTGKDKAAHDWRRVLIEAVAAGRATSVHKASVGRARRRAWEQRTAKPAEPGLGVSDGDVRHFRAVGRGQPVGAWSDRQERIGELSGRVYRKWEKQQARQQAVALKRTGQSRKERRALAFGKADPGAPTSVRERTLAARARGGKPAWQPDMPEGQKRAEAKRRGKQYGRALKVALVGWKRPDVGVTRKSAERVGKGVPVGDARAMARRTPKLVETHRRRELSPAMRETLSIMDPTWRSPSTAGVMSSDLALRPISMKPTEMQARTRAIVRVREDDVAAAARWADSVLRRKRAKEPKDQHVDALPTSRGSLGGEGR